MLVTRCPIGHPLYFVLLAVDSSFDLSTLFCLCLLTSKTTIATCCMKPSTAGNTSKDNNVICHYPVATHIYSDESILFFSLFIDGTDQYYYSTCNTTIAIDVRASSEGKPSKANNAICHYR
jgi:hypothetical protein